MMFNLFKRTDEQTYTEADVHTPANPYCSDFSCWCHTDLTLHADATEYHVDTTPYTEEEVQAARRFFGF